MYVQSYVLICVFFQTVLGLCPFPELVEDPTKKKCYMVSTFQNNWKEAMGLCQNYGGMLAKVEDNTDHQFLINHINTNHAYWIGMNDEQTEGSYVWTDNTPVTWTLWKSDQPNGDMSENCVIYGTNQQWQDYACDASYYFLCQIDRMENSLFKKVDTIIHAAVLDNITDRDQVACVWHCVRTADCRAVIFYLKTTSNNCKLLKAGGGDTFHSSTAVDVYKHSSFDLAAL